MKYIIVDDRGIELPIAFPNIWTHSEVARTIGLKVISAGFCSVSATETIECDYSLVPKWNVWGESISLKIKSRPEDSELITKAMNIR